MTYTTLLTEPIMGGLAVTLNRPQQRNTLSDALIADLNSALDACESDPEMRLLVLQGRDGVFCTGMDFEAAVQRPDARRNELAGRSSPAASGGVAENQHPFMSTLRRFSLSPRIIVSIVDGATIAGGVGLVAASDYVIATSKASFSLSEALWGLLPAMVTPYLIRRVGFQAAYRMTLTTLPVSGHRAAEIGLADEVSDSPMESLRRLFLRLSKLEASTVTNLKRYFRGMWIIDETMEQAAVQEISRLIDDPRVQKSIEEFVRYQRLPWER